MVDIVAADQWRQQPWRALTPLALPVDELWVHHGASGQPTLATLRAYERYHVRTRRWRAIGYSYAITGNGTVYEGRGAHTGAHTSGRNSDSVGVLLVGDWSAAEPPAAMHRSLARLALHLADTGVLEAPVISGGHRDAPDATTTCPGAGGMTAITRARALLHTPPHRRPTMLVYGQRGTPDYTIACAVADAHPGAAAATSSVEEAIDQRDADAPLVLVGGPAVEALLGDDARRVGTREHDRGTIAVAGADAVDTMRRLAELADEDWTV